MDKLLATANAKEIHCTQIRKPSRIGHVQMDPTSIHGCMQEAIQLISTPRPTKATSKSITDKAFP